MKCNFALRPLITSALALCLALLSLRCEEELPTYVFPGEVVSLNLTEVEQIPFWQTPNRRENVRIKLIGENLYDEVFQDSVNITGAIRIWWERYPDLYRTITLSQRDIKEQYLIHNGRMTLLPGQKFSMEIVWDLKTDKGLYLPNKMNFTRIASRECAPNTACADPEEFIIETSLHVYNRLGILTAEPKSFIFVAKGCIVCGRPPCANSRGSCE